MGENRAAERSLLCAVSSSSLSATPDVISCLKTNESIPCFVGAICNDGLVADVLADRTVCTEDGSAERLVGAGLVDTNSFGGCQG